MNERTRKFAESYYDQNSIKELSAPHAPADADATDMKEWGITAEEWSEAVKHALIERIADQYDTIPEGDPVAWKYADPTEDARWIYDASEADEIAREDSSLIIYV